MRGQFLPQQAAMIQLELSRRILDIENAACGNGQTVNSSLGQTAAVSPWLVAVEYVREKSDKIKLAKISARLNL
jgi:hypothetical protein